MRKKVMSIIISAVMVISISASLAQNVGEPSSSGTPGLPLSNISEPNPQIAGQPSSSLSGSGGLADSPWPMFRQNLNHTGVSAYNTSLNPGKLKWSFTTGSIVHSSPAIGTDGTIYIGSYDNNLYAVNPDGTEKWNFTANSGLASSPAIDSDGTIYVGSWDKNLYAINSNGIKKWIFASGGAIDSSPAIGPDGTIYIGSYDNKLYAINPDGSQKWNFTTGLNVRTSPAIDSDGTIYIGSLDFKLYAINPNGTEKWNIETGSYVEDSSPAIGPDGTIYVGSRDNKLYAINPNGTVRWTYTTGDEVCSSPAIGSDGTIYFGSQDNKFYAINPNGTEKWSFNTGGWVFSSPAIGSDGTIYVGSCDDNLYAINPDGTMKWNFTAGWYIVSSPAIGSDGTIYVGSHDKMLYAIGTPPSLKVNITSHFSSLNSAAQSTITVHVTDGTNPVQGATVNLVSDNGGIFSPQSGFTDANGDFKSIFNAPTVISKIICRISAEASKTGYNDGSGYVDVTIKPIPWPMFRHNLNHTGQSPYDTSINNGKLKWSFLTGARVVSSPAIGSDGTIYVSSFDNKLYAINPDGTEKWYFTTGAEVFSSPTIDPYGTIYVGSHDNRIYAINPDGSEKWNFTTGDMVYSSPSIGSDGTIYIGSHDHKLYAINPDGTLKWNFTTGQSVRSIPTIGYDGTIYVSSYDYKIYAINPDGSEKWNFETGGKVASSPAISSDGTIYAGSQDEKLYAINLEGIEKWNFTTSGWVWASPAVGSDGTIYIGSYDDKIYAINVDGSEKWNFTTDENIHSSPAIGSDGTIYSGSDDGILYAINPDGSLKWNFTTDGIVFSSPAIDVYGTIYVGSYDNKLYAIGAPIPDITIEKSANVTVAKPGDLIEYTIYYNNTGPDEAGTVWINDTLPEGVTFITSSAEGNRTGDYNWTFYNVPAKIPTWYGPYLPPIRPPFLSYGPKMVYDSINNRIVLFGGKEGGYRKDETWEYETATHTWYGPYTPSPRPSPRRDHAMAYDSINNKVVLFGGWDGTGTNGDETWEYDTATHTWYGPFMPANRPPCLEEHDMVYDLTNNRIVLFGGFRFSNGTRSDETWEYETATHTWYGPFITNPRPSPMHEHAMAYDSINNKVVLYGGWDGSGVESDETWEYETSTHTWRGPYMPAKRPPQLYKHDIVYDSTNNRIVLFGGMESGHYKDEIWEYETATHTWYGPYTPNPRPFQREEHAMAYDSINNRVVLFGGHGWGYTDTKIDETWEYNHFNPNYLTITVQINADVPNGTILTNYAHLDYSDSLGSLMLDSIDSADVLVLAPENKPPIANAGPDQTVNEGDVVQLNGSASYDPDVQVQEIASESQPNITYPYPWGGIGIFLNAEINASQGVIFDSKGNLSRIDIYLNIRDNFKSEMSYNVVLSFTDESGNLLGTASQMVNYIDKWYIFRFSEPIPLIAECLYFISIEAPDPDAFPMWNAIAVPGIDPYPKAHGYLNGTILDDFAFKTYLAGNEAQALKYEWDFGSDGIYDYQETSSSAPDGIFDGKTTHTYGDDGKYIVTLRVTDNQNLTAIDTCNVTVQNVDPTVIIESISMDIEIGLRVAGRKYNNVSMILCEDGSQLGYVSIERLPGSPNEQMVWIPVNINFSRSYNATVTYTPEDPPNVGGNPVWVYLKSKDGTINKIHHTFNVQQSKKRDSDHWNHVEPWEVDLNAHFIGLPFEITSHIMDPGSDDEILTLTYGSQVKTVTYLNNPPNPDPFPSPEVQPIDIMVTISLVYEGLGTVTLVVKDDDNLRLGVGQGSDFINVG